ncbi:parallel beta-helix repeat-containing protein [Emticicia oligotrophica DSM 17448]|uniref:Parallel beta-helix repeat-containing protein n=1 Tax=Emticicia oligotrophica (strain DSM 17448 / CIP 109782 / MTCC 6937 / GPTSA100-15) TaxID=929562 RepID=A0ABM5MYL4_EMTOG|nr:parallel beta-helix domain-containing protein [Emticicia oligotrophica]AFK02255.1 parallel beta-helix repeat-containing protein [Emticicia oligotrophica DSM 17448]
MKRIISVLGLSLSVSIAFAQKDIQKKIQTQFIMAENGSTIQLDEGSFTFTGSLSLEGKKNIIIKGKGKDKTILSFKGQTDGAEGIRVSNAENIIIEDLTVQDTKGDAVKTMNVIGITFRNVKTEWTGEPKETNGSYGLYPVQCEKVLIEGCEAIGASDAGIYVGQSKDIIVRNSRAYHNVAGIEIENSLNAEVYENEATENTGGILVFDLPDLVLKKGGFTKVYKNNVHHNNFPNFAPKGNIVGKVPDGTGVLILAANNVDIFDNQIINNKSMSVGVISYFITENPIKDKDYYPYPEKITVKNNVLERESVKATHRGRFGQIYRFKLRFGKNVPHILWDGIVDDKNPNTVICIKGNKNETFANIDAENGFKNIIRDASKYACK